MTSPRVSIVIPTYNQAAYLQEALESVRAQTVTDWEAIVVDNHSDDGTLQVLESFDDPRLSWDRIHNEGIIARSRNRGTARARADWVAFLDSDDRWRPDKLARCLEAAGPGVDVLGHHLSMFRGDQEVRVHRSGPLAATDYRALLYDGPCLTPSAALVRRDWLGRVGGYSEDPAYRTAEDWDLWLKLARDGARFAILDAVLTDYRVHEASSSRSVEAHRDASLRILADHMAAMDPVTDADRRGQRNRAALVCYGAARAALAAGQGRLAAANARRALGFDPLLGRAWAVALVGLVPGLRL